MHVRPIEVVGTERYHAGKTAGTAKFCPSAQQQDSPHRLLHIFKGTLVTEHALLVRRLPVLVAL